jgi:hypothetical protein
LIVGHTANAPRPTIAEDGAMPMELVISYDGTVNDDDALMLGRMLQAAGASLSLAYVRHAREYDPRREELGVHDADRRLQQGAVWLEDETIARHVVLDPSTSSGLAALAASLGAAAVVFGSDYRTAPGLVEPGGSAQGLLDGGAVAVGVAAAGLRTREDPVLRTISFAGDDAGGAAAATAEALATGAGAELIPGSREADLIVVDSRASAPNGSVGLDGVTRGWLDSARGSVLVLPRGTALSL